eukprot:SAG11_NODE_6208_length_1364_cov_0.815020_2_plen_98_part_00
MQNDIVLENRKLIASACDLEELVQKVKAEVQVETDITLSMQTALGLQPLTSLDGVPEKIKVKVVAVGRGISDDSVRTFLLLISEEPTQMQSGGRNAD